MLRTHLRKDPEVLFEILFEEREVYKYILPYGVPYIYPCSSSEAPKDGGWKGVEIYSRTGTRNKLLVPHSKYSTNSLGKWVLKYIVCQNYLHYLRAPVGRGIAALGWGLPYAVCFPFLKGVKYVSARQSQYPEH